MLMLGLSEVVEMSVSILEIIEVIPTFMAK